MSATILALAGCIRATAALPPAAAISVTPTPLIPLEPTPVPTPSSFPLTEAGCCARPWWSADGSQILFVDDPPGDRPLGVYALSPDGGEISLASLSLSGVPLSPLDLSAPALDLPAAARNIRLSPDAEQVAWSEGSTEPVNVDMRRRSVWASNIQDGIPRRRLTLIGGDLIGWAGDGKALVVSGRLTEGGQGGVWRVPLDGGPPLLLAPGERPRSAVLSPSGEWVAFYLAFEEVPARNGVWIVRTSGDSVRSLPGLASYRWGREGQFLFVPYTVGRIGLTLLELDLGTGETTVLFDEDAFPGGIASNEWSASPAGDRIVYRSAADGRLWVIHLG